MSTIADLYNNLKALCSQWFYTKAEIDTNKQDKLVSGSNLKTINNTSLLGSGNISVGGGSSVDIVTSWEQTLSDSKVPSEKLVKDSLDTKVETIDTRLADSGWETPTYESGYSDGNSSYPLQYRKIGNIVHLEGTWKNSSQLTSSTTGVKFATLDTGFRPSKNQYILQQGTSANKYLLEINADGSLKWSRHGTTGATTSISANSSVYVNATYFIG